MSNFGLTLVAGVCALSLALAFERPAAQPPASAVLAIVRGAVEFCSADDTKRAAIVAMLASDPTVAQVAVRCHGSREPIIVKLLEKD